MLLMICRGHIRAPKGPFQIFLLLTVLWQIDFLVKFALWSLFQVEFERVVNGLGGQRTGKIFIGGSQEHFFGSKTQKWHLG